MTDFETSQQRRWFAFAASAIGAGVAVLLNEPVGLLIAVAFATICFGLRCGVATAIVTSAATAAQIGAEGNLAKHQRLVRQRDKRIRTSVFGTSAVITPYRTISFYDQVYKTVRPTLEDIPGLGWSAYPDGRMRFVDTAATEFVGITAEEMKESTEGADTAWWTPFIHPDDSLALWRNSLKTGEPLIDEQRVRRFDGTSRWFRDSAIASRDENGEITAWYGSTVDITDQTNEEAALKASEQQLRELINTVPALIWGAGPDGKTISVNDQLIE
ncbi:hypothetical protein BLX90_24505 (plasmid) [Rhizobium sp. Y9]|nr:hypothetical protein BLX90_24505 [Rhizobium sp. Y9]